MSFVDHTLAFSKCEFVFCSQRLGQLRTQLIARVSFMSPKGKQAARRLHRKKSASDAGSGQNDEPEPAASPKHKAPARQGRRKGQRDNLLGALEKAEAKRAKTTSAANDMEGDKCICSACDAKAKD